MAPYTACAWPYTQFAGAFGLDFDSAPKRGRCAELIVRVEGKVRPLRAQLFRPSPRRCPPKSGRERGRVSEQAAAVSD